MEFGDNNDLNSEDVGEGIDEFSEKLSNPGFALKAILILTIVNALIWAAAIIYPNRIYGYIAPFSGADNESTPFLTFIPFITGAALGFAIVRYFRPWAGGYRDQGQEELGITASYSATEGRQKIWLIAAAAGVLNFVALLIVSSRLG